MHESQHHNIAALASLPATAAAMTGSAAAGLNAIHTATPQANPVFAAIERHRQATETRPKNADEAAKLALEEGVAMVAWVKTQPTTMAGVIATLEHASSLAPFMLQYDDEFPSMIAAALRKIADS